MWFCLVDWLGTVFNQLFSPPFHQSKIRAALDKAAYLPSPLTGACLTVVDVAAMADAAAAAALALEVPVVAWRTAGGGEARVARTPPRATADKVAAALVAAMPV